MTPWGEKPGGFSGMGGYGGDNAWLGNAKRQSLFRANPGPISWAGKPGIDEPLPATADVSARQSAQPASNKQFGHPVAAAPSLFNPGTNAFGITADQSRSRLADWQIQERETAQARQQMQSGEWQRQFDHRDIFANDPRMHQGQRLSDIFGGGFSGLPGTGSY